MLTSLLPLLWLVASGYGSVHAPFSTAVVRGHTPVPIIKAEHGNHGPTKDACSSGKSARSLNRRAGTHSDPDVVSPPAAATYSGVAGLRQLCVLFNGAEAPPGLANGWQFYWRTALEPRAPSVVS